MRGDNRDSAAPIPTFPATAEGTTVEATVELDPQISQCGQIDGIIWHRIDQAPDGTVALAVQGKLDQLVSVERHNKK